MLIKNKVKMKQKINTFTIVLVIILILAAIFLIFSYFGKDVRLSSVKCTTDSQCNNEKGNKYCVGGECEQCKDDDHYCSNSDINRVCIVRSDSTGTEYKCMPCRGNGDCSGSTWYEENLCNTATNSCGCKLDSDCKNQINYQCIIYSGDIFGSCKKRTNDCEENTNAEYQFKCIPNLGPGSSCSGTVVDLSGCRMGKCCVTKKNI